MEKGVDLPDGNQSQELARKKRKLSHDDGSTNDIGMGQPLSLLRQPDLPEFNLTSARPLSESGPDELEARSSQEWQTVEHGRKKKLKKVPKEHSSNYPTIEFSSQARPQTFVKIGDLQNLVLYILADGVAPQWISVRHRSEIRKVVVLMVPGLEKSMFRTARDDLTAGEEADGNRKALPQDVYSNYFSPDDYYPNRLKSDDLPASMKPFADMFAHLWPVRTPGDDKFGRMHSPLHAMLTAPLTKDKKEDKKRKGVKQVQEPHGWKNTRTRITEFIHVPEELLENDYTLHPSSYTVSSDRETLASHRKTSRTSEDDGWADSLVKDWGDGSVPEKEIEQGSITAGREVLAMDCEMCMTGENEFSLTRISVVGWDGSVVLDELVKPEKPITDYVTM